MLALDLDGTLLASNNTISNTNIDAIQRIQDVGVHIVPCTGRAWYESYRSLKPINHLNWGVFVTGAAISEIATGRTLNLTTIKPHVAMKIVEQLSHLPEAVLILRDKCQAGHDYMVTGRGELTPATRWWFEQNGTVVHRQGHITKEDLNHTLRIGLVAPAIRMKDAARELVNSLGDQAILHNFQVVQLPSPDQSVHILEVFAPGVDKWKGLKWIADHHAIDDAEIAVIGDSINDISMISAAGCGVAMGNASESVKATANYVTATNDENGVAQTIDCLMNEIWE